MERCRVVRPNDGRLTLAADPKRDDRADDREGSGDEKDTVESRREFGRRRARQLVRHECEQERPERCSAERAAERTAELERRRRNAEVSRASSVLHDRAKNRIVDAEPDADGEEIRDRCAQRRSRPGGREQRVAGPSNHKTDRHDAAEPSGPARDATGNQRAKRGPDHQRDQQNTRAAGIDP